MQFLLVLITVTSSVLNIILFFKLWSMTNNVSAIKSYLQPAKLKNEEILKLYLAGEQDKVQKALSNALINEYLELCEILSAKIDADNKLYDYNSGVSKDVEEYFSYRYDKVLEKYASKYAEFDVEIPAHFKSLQFRKIKQ